MANVTPITHTVNPFLDVLILRILSCVLWEAVSVILTNVGIKFMIAPWIIIFGVEMEFVEKVVMVFPPMDVLPKPPFTAKMETVSNI